MVLMGQLGLGLVFMVRVYGYG